MRKQPSLNFFSRLLLLIMLTVMGNGVHESAYATYTHVTAAGECSSRTEVFESQHCPCAPLGQHNDCDDCDTCVNCPCHAPLAVQPFNIGYNPVELDLSRFDQFNFLPEVYLSLFIPPDSAAV